MPRTEARSHFEESQIKQKLKPLLPSFQRFQGLQLHFYPALNKNSPSPSSPGTVGTLTLSYMNSPLPPLSWSSSLPLPTVPSSLVEDSFMCPTCPGSFLQAPLSLGSEDFFHLASFLSIVHWPLSAFSAKILFTPAHPPWQAKCEN